MATGRNITYSICPLIAGCDESIWTYYSNFSHLSMNQCTQQDNTDDFESFLYHLDDNNAFPARAAAAGPVRVPTSFQLLAAHAPVAGGSSSAIEKCFGQPRGIGMISTS